MDDFKLIDDLPNPDSGLHLTDEARDYLYKSGNWAMFFAVFGFLGLALNILIGIVFLGQSSALAELEEFSFLGPFIGIFYLVFAGVFAIPTWKQYQFATKSKAAARLKSTNILTEAMKNLHGHYKWYGIIIISFIAMYFLILFGAIGMAASAGNDFQF